MMAKLHKRANPKHRTAKAPAWGPVFAAVQQNTAISADLRFLISIVATLPPRWEFHFRWLRKVTGWGRNKLQNVLREAREWGFAELKADSAGTTFHGSTYTWQNAFTIAGIVLETHANSESPKTGLSDESYANPESPFYGPPENQTARKEGSQDLCSAVPLMKSSTKSSKAKTRTTHVCDESHVSHLASPIIPEQNYPNLIDFLRAYEIELDERGRGGLRRLWAEANGSPKDREAQCMDALTQAFEHCDGTSWDQASVITVALKILRGEEVYAA
jgi:hypothetical protein